MDYPEIAPVRLTGAEPLTAPNGEKVSDLLGFWAWAYSDLVGNTERGALAEYIVACALGIQNRGRISWDRFDLLSPEGISVEVKASGYIQTWRQEKLSDLSFGIQPTYGWDSRTNQYAGEKTRQAEMYVFCVHKHREQDTLNPLDIGQWDFYLLPAKVLNKSVGGQKRISLSSLIRLGAEKCAYQDLHTRIVWLIKNQTI